MDIQNYQIHNVLNVYRDRLIRRKEKWCLPNKNDTTMSDADMLFNKGNLHMVIEKVSAQVFKKVTAISPRSDFLQEVLKQTLRTNENEQSVEKDTRFVFKIIVGNNLKEIRSVNCTKIQCLFPK